MRFSEAHAWWRRRAGDEWAGLGIGIALAEKFVAEIDVVDPLGLARLHGQPCLFLANHQVFLESLMFNCVVPVLMGRATVAVAKIEHRERWLGRVLDMIGEVPGLPGVAYFDRENPDQIVDVVDRLARLSGAGQNVLVHVEGTRRRSCRRGRVQAMSPLWTEVAVAHDWPIVPVRFVGGLPVEDLGHKLDAPVGYGRQTIRLGPVIAPGELRGLDDAKRVSRVRAALNELSDNRTEEPGEPDPLFGAEVEERMERTGVEQMAAVILVALMRQRRAGGSLDPVCAAIAAEAETGAPAPCSALRTYLCGGGEAATLLQAS